ncbi:receptor-interacting serine/threonine-protein kinase 2-like [Protopterus annectens]|uniref:receptor-interacting serine/threonine-protein kinase 2-like n=1 Tax=Protopterus annectens TaxID=7888 RepID=UPI001CF9A8A1|nr:receptor-interacting serine/threonine-protein kinase 2-like [Protopterus annectens]
MSVSSHLLQILEEGLDNLVLIQTSTGFGFRAHLLSKKTDVSLKVLTNQGTTQNAKKEVLKEATSLCQIQSEHVLCPVAVYQCPKLVGLLTEWMGNGSLHSLLYEDHIYPDVQLALRVRILLDVAEGASHLHRLNPPVLHQAIKPSNVLLDGSYRAKLSDYGLTLWRRQCLKSIPFNCSSAHNSDLMYLAPERLMGEGPTAAADVYSFGVLCWETLNRRKPFQDKKTMMEVYVAVCKGERPDEGTEMLSVSAPQRHQLQKLVTRCWHQDSGQRPSFKECIVVLQSVHDTFSLEDMQSAVRAVTQAKERATEANKGLSTEALHIDIKNLELSDSHSRNGVLRPQMALSEMSTLPLTTAAGDQCRSREIRNRTLSADEVHSRGYASQAPAATSTGEIPTQVKKGLAPRASWPSTTATPPSSISSWCQPLPQHYHARSNCLAQSNCTCFSSRHHTAGARFQPELSCCQQIKYCREAIINSMTEGCLNHILDILRSNHKMAKGDYELITASQTLSNRTRALLDTCLCLGEGASKVVVMVLLAQKRTPALGNHCKAECQKYQ